MKKITVIAIIFLSACGLFNKDKDGGSSGGQENRGEFHPGPYTDPQTGKTCNAPGGFCTSDKKCHSSASKCPKL